jgi:hypothetical protein
MLLYTNRFMSLAMLELSESLVYLILFVMILFVIKALIFLILNCGKIQFTNQNHEKASNRSPKRKIYASNHCRGGTKNKRKLGGELSIRVKYSGEENEQRRHFYRVRIAS